MENIFLKKRGGIYYRHSQGTLCVHRKKGAKYYARQGVSENILLYALDDGNFTTFRLIPSHMRYVYSSKFKSYRADKKGTIKIFGHYPFFVAIENKIKKYGLVQRKQSQLIYTPVWLDIDGKFYREPVVNFKERLQNKKPLPKKPKYIAPVLKGIECIQCNQKIQNVRSKNHLFCSDGCRASELRSRNRGIDYRYNRDREEEGLIEPAYYYVCVLKVSPRGYKRLDWIGGPYESESAAEATSDPFRVRYEKDHGWSPGHHCVVRRLTKDRPTLYGFKP